MHLYSASNKLNFLLHLIFGNDYNGRLHLASSFHLLLDNLSRFPNPELSIYLEFAHALHMHLYSASNKLSLLLHLIFGNDYNGRLHLASSFHLLLDNLSGFPNPELSIYLEFAHALHMHLYSASNKLNFLLHLIFGNDYNGRLHLASSFHLLLDNLSRFPNPELSIYLEFAHALHMHLYSASNKLSLLLHLIFGNDYNGRLYPGLSSHLL